MKIKNRHLAVAFVLAGLAVSGCSQQQTAAALPVMEATPEPVPVVDYVPEPQPVPQVQPQVQRPRPVVRPAPVAPVARPVMPPVKVPQVKAKGTYRGSVQIDRNAVQQYQY